MKHPCVELYFEVETGPLDIRIWLKTNDTTTEGRVSERAYLLQDSLLKSIFMMRCVNKEEMIQFLEVQNGISAFQVAYRHDGRRTGIVVYREWP